MLIAPQRLELSRIVLIGRAGCLGNEREDRLGERQPPAAGQRHVGDQRRRAWRTVDQGHLLLWRQRHPPAQLEEQASQRQHLTRPAVGLRGNGGQLRGIEHRHHGPCGLASYGGVSFQKVGQTSHDDRPHDALRQRLAERHRGPQLRRTPLPRRLVESLSREIAGSRGDPVHERLWVGAQPVGNELLERLLTAIHHRYRLGSDLDGGGVHRCIGAGFALTEARMVMRTILRRLTFAACGRGEASSRRTLITVPRGKAVVTLLAAAG